ncbi:amidophosphoribosyltransferase [Dyella lipolytica]|uniref:ComF family protein n=1 Tax=Dyella lipolytica TaxID=1867835 RepID=A0ABW8ISM8_9GAMM|nr:ComF family protein [Dyella lipolytica]GLQ47309.1 amidophosphoribosyltransferase [Dyella lipolytica]
MDAPKRLLTVLHRWLLPWRCLLCGDAGAEGVDLCAACIEELPRNTHCCERCALPLPVSAPLCGRCLRKAPQWHAAWAPFRYAWPLDRLETRFKFSRDLAAGRVLATLWQRQPHPPALPQLILPVPLHRRRLRERGYNQALEMARPLARALNIPCAHDVLRRVRHTDAQTALDATERRRNLRGAFALRGDVALPAHVAVLDDVFTTGTTLSECTRVLKRAGVERVDVWALARAPIPGR